MADGAGMVGAPLDVSGRKPGAAGGIHAVDSDAAVVVWPSTRLKACVSWIHPV